MTDVVWDIERKRRRLGISQSQLASFAGVNRSHYSDIVHRKKEPRRDTVAKLRHALSRYENGRAEAQPAMIYRLCLLYVCQVEHVDFENVLAQDPKRRATFDPAWKRAADAREKALYVSHTICGVPQRQLAAAAGVTPAAVSLAMGRVEDACEPDETPLFQLVETALGGL